MVKNIWKNFVLTYFSTAAQSQEYYENKYSLSNRDFRKLFTTWLLYSCPIEFIIFVNETSSKSPNLSPDDISFNDGFSFVLICISLITASFIEISFVNIFYKRSEWDLFWRRFYNSFLTTIISLFVVGLGTLFFIFPGVILFKKYMYAPIIAANELLGPFESMRKSSLISNINGWNVFRGYTIRLLIYGSLFYLFNELAIFNLSWSDLVLEGSNTYAIFRRVLKFIIEIPFVICLVGLLWADYLAFFETIPYLIESYNENNDLTKINKI